MLPECIDKSLIPEDIEKHTAEAIPKDITDDEIDKWLAVIPELIEFWEQQVAKKRLDMDLADQNYKMDYTLAYNKTPDTLAVKNRENIANCDAKVEDSSRKYLQAKYEMQIVQAVFNKCEAKSKSIHKIASLRARRLEQGVVGASVRGNPVARNNPVPRYNGPQGNTVPPRPPQTQYPASQGAPAKPAYPSAKPACPPASPANKGTIVAPPASSSKPDPIQAELREELRQEFNAEDNMF